MWLHVPSHILAYALGPEGSTLAVSFGRVARFACWHNVVFCVRPRLRQGNDMILFQRFLGTAIGAPIAKLGADNKPLGFRQCVWDGRFLRSALRLSHPFLKATFLRLGARRSDGSVVNTVCCGEFVFVLCAVSAARFRICLRMFFAPLAYTVTALLSAVMPLIPALMITEAVFYSSTHASIVT